MATIDSSRLADDLSRLRSNVDAWAVPEALIVDQNLDVYLNLNFSLYPRDRGVSPMKVSMAAGTNEYTVDITGCGSYRWPITYNVDVADAWIVAVNTLVQ